ncbi:MAG: FeoB-associated Cys-rich membrane protein [Treponema sp.]|nr:FeoB-associated Cys-rich membrane protein [Treponema sp.]
MGTIVVGTIVFAVLAAAVIRLALNARKGKTSCGCGCAGCDKKVPK